MNASEKTAIIALVANLLAEHLEEEQLVAAASILTQLGTTLGFLAAQRAFDTTGRTGVGVVTPSEPAQTPSFQAPTETPPSQGSAPSQRNPVSPAASSATGR